MYNDYKKNFQNNFDKLSRNYSKYVVFSDFVKICAISIYNSIAKDKGLEKDYLKTIKTYRKEDQILFSKMFADLIMMYQTVDDIIDILGPIYEHENLSNPQSGQFFTPSNIAELMSKISIYSDKNNFEKIIKEKGFITMCEPCCGSGVMIIAFTKVLKSFGINYQEDVLVTANDISDVCTFMTYIQLALYGIPAIVYCGNALTGEVRFKMETPLYFLHCWKFRKAFIQKSKDNTTNQKEIIIDKTIQNNFKEIIVKGNCQISLF